MNKMEQLRAFCDFERKVNPQMAGKQHIAEWAAEEIERLRTKQISTDGLKDIPHIVTIGGHDGIPQEIHDFEGPGCMERAHAWAQAESVKRRNTIISVACRVRRITTPPGLERKPALEHESVYIGKLRRIWREEYLDDDHTMSFGEWLREAAREYE